MEYPLVNIQKLWKITMLLMGKLTVSMAIFNSYVKLPEDNPRTPIRFKCSVTVVLQSMY